MRPRALARRAWFRRLPACLLCLWALAAAAAPSLRVDMTPLVSRPRTAGLVPVDVRLRWEGSRLLEGRLAIEVRDGNKVQGIWRSAEMALTTGVQGFNLMLPLQPIYAAQADCRLWFETTDSQRMELDPVSLPAPAATGRGLVVAIVGDGSGVSVPLREVFQSLRLERLAAAVMDPVHPKGPGDAVTAPAWVSAEDLPGHPLSFCAYDLVVLTPEGLGSLKERQRQALVRWVSAGGSVCVLAGAQNDAGGRALLNGLADGDTRWPIEGSRGAPEGILCFHTGLGRSVIVSRSLDLAAVSSSPEWRRAVAFLWKVRRDFADHEAGRAGTQAGGTGRKADPRRNSGRAANQETRRLAESLSALGGQCLSLLMPQSVRMIPLPAMLGVLGLYLLFVGPVDWWLLGRLKRRPLTWIWFPAMTVLCALVLVGLADHYLGKTDRRRALVVVDVGRGGAVLRQNRFELMLAGRDRDCVSELRGACWAAMDAKVYRGGYYYGVTSRGAGDATPAWEGTPPGVCRVTRKLRQWEPELSRRLTLEAGALPPAPLDWTATDRHVRGGSARVADPRSMLADPRMAADVVVYRGGVELQSDLDDSQSPGYVDYRDRRTYRTGIAPADVVRPLSVFPAREIFRVVSQLSPGVAGTFDDMAVLDASDSRQCLVVVVTRCGEDIVMYRRMYYGDE